MIGAFPRIGECVLIIISYMLPSNAFAFFLASKAEFVRPPVCPMEARDAIRLDTVSVASPLSPWVSQRSVAVAGMAVARNVLAEDGRVATVALPSAAVAVALPVASEA